MDVRVARFGAQLPLTLMTPSLTWAGGVGVGEGLFTASAAGEGFEI